MTAERHMVKIETERTGKIALTPDQFDLLLTCALIGLDGAEEMHPGADALWEIVNHAYERHALGRLPISR
jgi:hypothetical protein